MLHGLFLLVSALNLCDRRKSCVFVRFADVYTCVFVQKHRLKSCVFVLLRI